MTPKLPTGMLTGKDRRAAPRRPARPRVKVECRRGSLGLGPNCAEALWDLSQIGVRIVARDELSSGQDVELALEGPTHRRPVKLDGVVIWSQSMEAERYFIGVRLRKPLPYLDLTMLT